MKIIIFAKQSMVIIFDTERLTLSDLKVRSHMVRTPVYKAEAQKLLINIYSHPRMF